MRRKGDKATPWHNGSMNDQISLKDCIMRDDIDKERDAEMICDITETIQCKDILSAVLLVTLVSVFRVHV